MSEAPGYRRFNSSADVPLHPSASTADEEIHPNNTPGYGNFGSDNVTEMRQERPLSDSFPSAAEQEGD